jgi:hypothetical protein
MIAKIFSLILGVMSLIIILIMIKKPKVRI